MSSGKSDDTKGKYICTYYFCKHVLNVIYIGGIVTCIIKVHYPFSLPFLFPADYTFCVHQRKISLMKNCSCTNGITQDSELTEDKEPFICNLAGFSPLQSPEEFFHPKCIGTGHDLDNIIFKTIYAPDTLFT